MRLPLTTLLIAWLLGALAACGATSPAVKRGEGVARASDNSQGHHRKDLDNDEDNNDDDRQLFAFGHMAGPEDGRAIYSLIARYYAAAAHEDGRTACRMLAPFVAESVVEDYGYTKDLHGSTCAAVMSRLFRREHLLLARKDATLRVLRIGVEGDRSLVALDFASIHEARQMSARRVGGRWTILRLLDGIIE